MATELRRSLNLVQLTFYGVGTIVGAGIYSVLGAAAGVAGEGLWISLLFAGAAALLTGLSYAELVSLFPRAGAEYHFLKEAFPRWPLLAFLAGFLIALNASATSATVALAFGGYARVFADLPAWVPALGLLSTCTVINILGIREATWVSIGIICVEVGGLLLLIGAGWWRADVVASIALPSADALPALLLGAGHLYRLRGRGQPGVSGRRGGRGLGRAALASLQEAQTDSQHHAMCFQPAGGIQDAAWQVLVVDVLDVEAQEVVAVLGKKRDHGRNPPLQAQRGGKSRAAIGAFPGVVGDFGVDAARAHSAVDGGDVDAGQAGGVQRAHLSQAGQGKAGGQGDRKRQRHQVQVGLGAAGVPVAGIQGHAHRQRVHLRAQAQSDHGPGIRVEAGPGPLVGGEQVVFLQVQAELLVLVFGQAAVAIQPEPDVRLRGQGGSGQSCKKEEGQAVLHGGSSGTDGGTVWPGQRGDASCYHPRRRRPCRRGAGISAFGKGTEESVRGKGTA